MKHENPDKEPIPLRQRIWLLANVGQGGPRWCPDINGCWIWQGNIRTGGYGGFTWREPDGTPGSMGAHVAMFTAFYGPVPDGLEVDHLCHNADPTCPGVLHDGTGCTHRRCVNPAHLEAVPPEENKRRSHNWRGNQTHCIYGHPFDLPNTYSWNGRRKCKECGRERSREYERRQRAAAKLAGMTTREYKRRRRAAKIANQQPNNQET